MSTRTKIYSNIRYKTENNFRVTRKTSSRIRQALRGKIKSSSTSTKGILGIDNKTDRKWIEYQMTPGMNCCNMEIDHEKPIFLFDVPEDDELRETFSWKNTQPLLKEDQQRKVTELIFLELQLQLIKAYHFTKLNEEGYN